MNIVYKIKSFLKKELCHVDIELWHMKMDKTTRSYFALSISSWTNYIEIYGYIIGIDFNAR